MKTIQLNKCMVALISDEDFDLVNKYRWHVKEKSNTFYAVTSMWKNGKSKIILMHRLILELSNPDIKVDHKDHNGLNNQRNNIRAATQSQNLCNRKSKKTGSSKYLGVHLHSRGNFWVSEIRAGDGSRAYLGIFKDEKDAAIAYNQAALKHHGQFANLNVIT